MTFARTTLLNDVTNPFNIWSSSQFTNRLIKYVERLCVLFFVLCHFCCRKMLKKAYGRKTICRRLAWCWLRWGLVTPNRNNWAACEGYLKCPPPKKNHWFNFLFKCAFPGLFYLFPSFYEQLRVINWPIKVSGDWIRTGVGSHLAADCVTTTAQI